jgi:hypothetical protein
MTARGDTWFAVAVRDALDLWLYLEIKRSWRSDVYVFWPYPSEGQLHVSYHRDGHWWATCYDDMSGGRRHQQPDVMLSGIERVVTTPIHFSGVRGFDTPCRYARSRERYSGIFEIGRDEISATKVRHTTSLAIDIAEPGAIPSVPNFIRHMVFTDDVPHIHLTLWDPA